jgi:LuxR family maltose regulon positive regulatory protein
MASRAARKGTMRRPRTRRSSRAEKLLPAKLARPERRDAISRPRLFRALDHLTQRPITWLHAPAGAGKTTLLSTYLTTRGARTLWYDVDAGDADESSLFHYLRIGAEALVGKSLRLPPPRPGPPEAQRAYARRFFETLFAGLPARSFLVFDNYQDAGAEPAWNHIFRELAAAITPRVRVLVASRLAPPSVLARLQAGGHLQVLDWSKLRLDASEVRGFLRCANAGADAKDAVELLSLTDGWAVAVSLLSRQLANPERVASRAKTRWRAKKLDTVFPFLATEVLEQLDPGARELLLDVALLPSFTATMAATLSGRTDAAQLLAKLSDDHLLLERQGENGFRLHDLFRAFLLERGRRHHGEEAWRALSVHAAMLLSDREEFQEATELLRAAAAWQALGDLIERRAPALAEQGRLATIAHALAPLPAEHLEHRPWLSFWQATVTLGHPGGRARALAERAFTDFQRTGDRAGVLLAWALVVQAIVITGDDFGQLGRWLPALDELSVEPPAPAVTTRVAVSQALGFAFWEVGTARSMTVADRALDVVGRQGTVEDRVVVRGAALLLYFFGGRVERAQEMRRLARKELHAANADPLAKLAYLHSEAMLAQQDGGFAACGQAVEEGLSVATASGIEVWNGSLLTLGILSAVARADLATAERYLDAMSVGAVDGPRFARAQYAYARGWVAFERRELDAALRWNADSIEGGRHLGFKFSRCTNAIAEVIYRATLENHAGLAEALDLLDRSSEEAPCAFLTASAELSRAYARLCLGEDALDPLRTGFELARQCGYVCPGFLGRSVILPLVTTALAHDIEADFARKLVLAYALSPGPEALDIAGWPWPVKVRALGPLAIEVQGRKLRFGRKTPSVPLALLKVLAASRGPVTVARLSALLWPGYGNSAPRGALDTALYRLRKLLGANTAIESENGRISLSEQVCWTDTKAFAVVCDRITRLAGAKGDTPGIETIQRCEHVLLDLYRGPFGDDDDPPFVARARVEFHRRFTQAVAELQELWRRVGRTERNARLAELVGSANL